MNLLFPRPGLLAGLVACMLHPVVGSLEGIKKAGIVWPMGAKQTAFFFFVLKPFWIYFFTNKSIRLRLACLDPGVDVIHHGTEVTHLDSINHDAEHQTIAADVSPMWHGGRARRRAHTE